MFAKAIWTKIASCDQLKRSSVCVSSIDSKVYVFGGEMVPRLPRDNNIYEICLAEGGRLASVNTIAEASELAPSPRVGAATTALGGKIYLYSGRGGEEMAPIDEHGNFWVLDPSLQMWRTLEPASDVYPEPRSYHCLTNDGLDCIYLHGGCPEKGRLSDLWMFSLSTRRWTQLMSAPDPPRGGASLAFVHGKIYRMNGFDGKIEQGGHLDVFDPDVNNWTALSYDADGSSGPSARSVAGLVPVRVCDRTYLVTLFGESHPSSLGHQGAGTMLSDVWAFSLEEKRWKEVCSDATSLPEARGWFDADAVIAYGKEGVLVVGGLGESNVRLDDAWLMNFT